MSGRGVYLRQELGYRVKKLHATMLTPRELAGALARGSIRDGYTIAAIALAQVRGLLRIPQAETP